MLMTYLNHFAALFTALVFLISAPHAQAQSAPCSDHPACEAALPTGEMCRIYLDAPDGTATLTTRQINGQVNGVDRAVPSGCYDPERVYGIAGWRFNTRGGNKLRELGFEQGRGVLRFALADGDGGDFADGFVWLVALPAESELRSVSASCKGPCPLQVEREDPNEEQVLAGFNFNRQGGGGHIRDISIESPLFPSWNYYANFSDDDFDYDVTLQYAVVPPGFLGPRVNVLQKYNPDVVWGRVIEGEVFVHPRVRAYTGEVTRLLHGFSFEFKNGGHFIEDIGVEPFPTEFHGWFQDHQGDENRRLPDDPFEWGFYYSPLR